MQPNFYNFIFHPENAWKEFLAGKNFFLPAAVFLFGNLFLFIALRFPIKSFLLFLPFLLAGWVLSTAVYYFFGSLFKGAGNIVYFFYLWSFTFLPFFFLPSASILSDYSALIGVLLGLVVLLWSVILKVSVIKSVFGLGYFVSFVVLIIPYVLFGGVFLTSILLWGASNIL